MYLCSDKLKHLAKEKQTEKKMLDEAAMPEGDETYTCMQTKTNRVSHMITFLNIFDLSIVLCTYNIFIYYI